MNRAQSARFRGETSFKEDRYCLPNYVWQITHRCHKKEFLRKFACDRRRRRAWLFEARKRYALCVLDYIVTSNHIHLLVRDRGWGEIAKSMQLVAGRTAQEYNQRKSRRGAYREDRYHATAVDSQEYLPRCMAYIDMNMVRAGLVEHPAQWALSRYREIQAPPQRYAVIDHSALQDMLGFRGFGRLQRARAGGRYFVECKHWKVWPAKLGEHQIDFLNSHGSVLQSF
ncbi:MAG: transposase [Gammaproteobacteria bacterium]